ncbi:MAG: hypothetical protein ACLSA6_06355 [Holdemania massiliensis]
MAACRTVNIGRLKLEDLTTVIDQLQDQFDFICWIRRLGMSALSNTRCAARMKR